MRMSLLRSINAGLLAQSRRFYSNAKTSFPKNGGDLQEISGSDWRVALKEEIAKGVPKERDAICIYRVPINMRQVEPKAYSPNIISIGPYHQGEERLQEMEQLKWKFCHRLFDSSRPKIKLDPVINAMEELEQEARSCYEDEIKISREDFVEMMLVDGCFIIELFRELKQHNFRYAPSIQRWMLPTLRRDLIMLENQLPLCVLQKLFELTSSSAESNTSLRDLALQFFTPLLQRDPTLNCISKEVTGRHFLDLFRSSIIPKVEEKNKTSESCKSTENKGMATDLINTMRPATELIEAGFIIKKGKTCLLDIRLEKRVLYKRVLNKRVLKIPPLYIDDYKGTLPRNLVAFEQCHRECRPYVTSYLFFFDGLINSAEDVELLHHKEVIHHSLGHDKEVARLINSLCKEIAYDGYESYLHKVVSDANSYYHSRFAKIRAKLSYRYFTSWMVGISTLAGMIVIYLTLIQTGCAVRDASKSKMVTFLDCMKHAILDPLSGHFSFAFIKDVIEGLKSKLANLLSLLFNFTSTKDENGGLKSKLVKSFPGLSGFISQKDETNQENQSKKTSVDPPYR